MKVLYLLFAIALISIHSYAQTKPDNSTPQNTTADVSKRIDEVYASFSKSYTLPDASMTSQCYTEKAVAISHYSNQAPTLIYGKPSILNDFKGFFEATLAKKETLTIQFKIIERKTNGVLVFDKGYYKLTASKDSQVQWISYGKIAIILEKDAAGNWKYSVDTNATATEAEFTKAVQLQ